MKCGYEDLKPPESWADKKGKGTNKTATSICNAKAAEELRKQNHHFYWWVHILIQLAITDIILHISVNVGFFDRTFITEIGSIERSPPLCLKEMKPYQGKSYPSTRSQQKSPTQLKQWIRPDPERSRSGSTNEFMSSNTRQQHSSLSSQRCCTAAQTTTENKDFNYVELKQEG